MQVLMNATRVEQPVPGREHSGPEQLIPRRERRDKKGRKAQRPTANRTEPERFSPELFS